MTGLVSLNRAITLNPNSADAYNNRGVALQGRKRLDEALANYDRAITLRPGHALAHNNRGTVLELMKRYDEVLADFDKAIALNPNYAEAYYNRGNLLTSKGEMEEAQKALVTALEFKPDLHRATHALTSIRKYDDLNGEEVRNIHALLDNSGTPPADRGYLYFSLGKIYDDCGQYDDGLPAMRREIGS